jgi:hypothetical protein
MAQPKTASVVAKEAMLGEAPPRASLRKHLSGFQRGLRTALRGVNMSPSSGTSLRPGLSSMLSSTHNTVNA